MIRKEILISVLPHLLALFVMIGASTTYFYPQLEDKYVLMDDAISGVQAGGEISEYKAKTGKDYYLWSNGQFGGMPKMVWVPMKNNHILNIYDLFRVGFAAPIGLYLAIMIFCYLLYYYLSKSVIISTSLAIATSLNTCSMMLWTAGHYSKITTLAYTPLIILGVLLIYEKRNYIWGFITLTFALGASLTTQHPQMTYYIMMFFLIFGLVYIIDAVKNKTLPSFLKSSGVAILAALLALSISSTRMMSVYDFSKSTIRGAAILASDAKGNSSIEDKGVGWEYATQWSNDSKDLIASLMIPRFVGGGSSEKMPKDSQSFKKYKLKRAPMYWGNLPFTVGPMYLGVTMFYLFILGLFFTNGKLKIWFGVGVGLMVLFSMGKNFEFLNKLIFNYMPMYDKFRAPQSILNTLAFYLPVLGIFGLTRIIDQKESIARKSKTKAGKAKRLNLNKKLLRNFYSATTIIIIPLVLLTLFGSSFLSFESIGDQRYVQQGLDINDFISDRKDLFFSDALRSLILISVIGIAIWLFLINKLSKLIISFVIGVVVVFDIVGVSNRYLAHDDFERKKSVDSAIGIQRPVDKQIKSIEIDRAKYRVQDFSINTNNSSATSFYHNTIGGYDPAKLRRYQDLIERHITPGNQKVYDMLNTKYFIVNGSKGPELRTNPNALGNAWFVSNIQAVNTPNEEIDILKEFDPNTTAIILESEFGSMIKSFNYDSTAAIELKSYEPDELIYTYNANEDQLAVFSEVWYNGNRDWKSYIDGKEVDHIRVNYALRGMFVPAGEHEITFKFMPVVYATGERISFIGWWLFVGLILGAIGFEIRKSRIRLKSS